MTKFSIDGEVSGEFNRLSQSEIVLDRLADDQAPQGLVLDVAKYIGYLDGSGLSEAESDIVLREIWKIVVAFVDLGHGTHPAQQAMDKSKMIGGTEQSSVVSSGSVHSDNDKTEDGPRKRAARRERIHGPR